MRSILKLKTWQIFIALTFALILILITNIFNLSIKGCSTIQTVEIFRILGLMILTLWLFIVGLELNRIDSNKYKFNNLILTLASISFFVGYASLGLARFPHLDSMIPLSIQILLGPLTFFGIIYLFYNIPMSLKSLELGRKAKFSECLLDALLFFSCAMGIGIWWLQPRINKVYKEKNH